MRLCAYLSHLCGRKRILVTLRQCHGLSPTSMTARAGCSCIWYFQLDGMDVLYALHTACIGGSVTCAMFVMYVLAMQAIRAMHALYVMYVMTARYASDSSTV